MAFIRSLALTVARHWTWVALATCIAMLAAVHAIEAFQHLKPCHMCLKQREAYWIAGAIALAGCALGCTRWGPKTMRIVCVLLAAAFAYGLYWAVYQTGGEYHWWTLPASCDVDPHATAVTAEDMMKLLNGTLKQTIVACGSPAWWFPDTGGFKGLTMAGWDAIILLKMIGWSLFAASRKPAA